MRKEKAYEKNIVLSFSGVDGTICACGSGGGGDKDKVTLIVDLHGWMPTINTTATASTPNVYNSPRYIAEAFEKLYPEVKIEWARTKNVGGSSNDASGEMSSYFINAIEKGTCPAIAFSWGTAYQERDYYIDLTEYLEQPNPFETKEELKGKPTLYNSCAIITDGRFSGGTSGLSVGYVSPEAALCSPLSIVEDNDEIEIDIPRRSIRLMAGDDEIAARMAAQQHFRPAARDRRIPASLRAYAKLVSSADKGAVRIVEEE